MKFKQNLPVRNPMESDESKEWNEMVIYISNTTELSGFFISIDWNNYWVDIDGIIHKNENRITNPDPIIPIYENRILNRWRFCKI